MNNALGAALLMAALPAAALNVGEISSFLYSDNSTLGKTISNPTDSGRLITIHLDRLSSPLADGQPIPMETPGEVLLTPASLLLPAHASEVVRFFYRGPVDDRERYYRIVWFDQALSDAPGQASGRRAVATASARIGTLLVIAPRRIAYGYQFAGQTLTNTGNATLRIVAWGPCAHPAEGSACKEHYFLMPARSRRFTRVNLADSQARVALWQGEQFVSVK
ncbi:hypothetical protein [Pantoea sp. 1.19]|uniref:EcpB family pilus assembly chaperone n=1 Tax=Pantoea sp. 1.19 TaxID=1925589 RepID=UPI000948B00F|nr:hypothetical protein [Pantoea sp. 1.19]